MLNLPENVVHVNHPLLQHKLSLMREKKTRSVIFRALMKEAGMILGVEATKELKSYEKDISTPLEDMKAYFLNEPEPAVVSILRAGNGLLEGLLQIMPHAAVGFLGMSRDHDTLKPIDYYQNLPDNMSDRSVIIVDPMLATAGSGIEAVRLVKKAGATSITFVCLLAAPEGIEAFNQVHSDVKLVTGSIDRQLNEKGYILPGLGDAGDRIYGT
jgi:uracil phosphoribosyltransferase